MGGMLPRQRPIPRSQRRRRRKKELHSRALQPVAPARGDDQRLLRQPQRLGLQGGPLRRFLRLPKGLRPTQPRQVEQDCGFNFNQVDRATAGQRLGEVVGGGQVVVDTVGAYVVAFNRRNCSSVFIGQFEGAAGCFDRRSDRADRSPAWRLGGGQGFTRLFS